MHTYNSDTLHAAIEFGQLNWLCSNPLIWLKTLLKKSLEEEAEAEAQTPHGLTEDERDHWTIGGYHDWTMTDPWNCTVTYHYDPDDGSTAMVSREGYDHEALTETIEECVWQLNAMRHM